MGTHDGAGGRGGRDRGNAGHTLLPAAHVRGQGAGHARAASEGQGPRLQGALAPLSLRGRRAAGGGGVLGSTQAPPGQVFGSAGSRGPNAPPELRCCQGVHERLRGLQQTRTHTQTRVDTHTHTRRQVHTQRGQGSLVLTNQASDALGWERVGAGPVGGRGGTEREPGVRLMAWTPDGRRGLAEPPPCSRGLQVTCALASEQRTGSWLEGR